MGGSVNSARRQNGPHSTVIRVKLRGGVNNQNISWKQLGGAIGAIATSTTSLRFLAKSLKVNYVKVIVPPTQGGAVNDGEVRFQGGGNTQEAAIHKNSTNSNKAAYIFAKPPKNTLANDWHTVDSDDTCMTFSCSVNSIIEFGVSFYFPPYAEGAPQFDTTGKTTGSFYYQDIGPFGTLH